MESQQNQHKIKTIYRMLLEIINGNLTYRIPLVENDKQFNEVAKMLNEVAEKLQSAKYTNPYLIPKEIKALGTDRAAILIQQVQDYILNHLGKPLPSTGELSEMFGTNEFTLKQNFRNLLKTSIYQYYNDERLKKAHLLIQQTNIPLKNIALLSGFKEYTVFLKAFRKKYRCKPSEVSRSNTLKSEE
ncbi:helix-turn-helix domain-containing protein [Flavobacterium sp.]|uniref:helix-turn-helix domain-containing protein n=1 Tax=Flavobacterium sp. TaxID=239 RepID=UPI0039192D5D